MPRREINARLNLHVIGSKRIFPPSHLIICTAHLLIKGDDSDRGSIKDLEFLSNS